MPTNVNSCSCLLYTSKEREEKDKQRQEQRKLMKDAIIKEIRKGDDKISKNLVNDDAAKKKKRNRINKERVDINAAGTTNVGGASNNNQRNDNANRPVSYTHLHFICWWQVIPLLTLKI